MSVGLGSQQGTNAEDDVKAAYEELKAKASTEPEEAEEEAIEDLDKLLEGEDKAEEEEAPEVEEEEEEEEIPPPIDWTADAKEWFKTQPKEFQKEAGRIADQYNKHRQKELWKINQDKKALESEKAEIEDAAKIVRKWLPRWNAQGKTEANAIAELCAFNELIIRDPDAAIEQLAKVTGRKVQIEGRQAKPSQSEPLDYHTIKERVKADLATEASQLQIQHQNQVVVQQVDQALTGLLNETNGAGKYIYPDLHNVEFQAELEPLALGIRQKNPNLPWRDVIIRAYRANEGRVNPKSIPTQPKLIGSRTDAAKRAASSVSGNLSSSQKGNYESLPGETVEQSVARALRELTNQ